MIKMLKKTIHTYRAEGLGSVIVKVLVRLGMHTSEIVKARKKANQLVRGIHNDKVAYGRFSGMTLSNNVWWGRLDFAGKILGTYEKQVIDKLVELSRPGGLFIDIGSADGFFAVGMLRGGWFSRAVCFEISEKGREVTGENASKNDVFEKITIRGQAASTEIMSEVSQAEDVVILCDIEGAEFALFDDFLLKQLSGKSIVIEVHSHLVDGGDQLRDELVKRAKRYFKTEIMSREAIPVGAFSELSVLSDDERMLAFSEGRGAAGEWLVLSR